MQPPQHQPIRALSPRKARRDFLEEKKDTLKHSSYRAYKFPTKHFVDYLEDHDIEVLHETDPYTINQWKLARKDDGIAPATYRSNVKQVKVFLRWCENAGLIHPGTTDRVSIPTIPPDVQVSHVRITEPEARAVLDYLSTYEYASRQHAEFFVLWETACRVSGLIALDVEDFVTGENKLVFENRRETDTPLKNGPKSERNVTISDELVGLLTDYIEGKRPDVVDEYGRNPLFCTDTKRVSRQRVYKNVTGYTRPCVYANHCPHDRDPNECEAGKKKRAFGCPSSVNSHPVRRGSITHHLNVGWPKQKVSERCDVSMEILEKHYNEQTKEDERENRKEFVGLL